MSDIAYVEAKIATLRIKLSAAKTDEGKFYYRACLRGWQMTLEKLKAKDTHAEV